MANTHRQNSMCGASALALGMALMAAPVAAFAQATPSGSGDDQIVSEVVVTAQKREERLQDVPISISVLGGEELDRSTGQGVQDMISRSPGVTFESNTNGLGTQVAIRGVSAPFSTVFGGSTVAYYLDAVPFGFVRSSVLPDPDIYDLDRIEILRGPQGTLYGAGGAGGVVRVLTEDADLDTFGFKSRVNLSHTEHGGENGRADLAVNAPLIEGKLAVRGSLSYKSFSGWVDSPACRNCNDSEARTARLKVNAQPTENLSVGASAWIYRSDRGAIGWAVDGGRTDFGPSHLESGDLDFDIYGLKVGYDFPNFSLMSSTGYLDFDATLVDGNANPAVQVLTIQTPATTFVQEVNLTSTHEGPWRWTLGGIYRDAEDVRRELRQTLGFPSQTRFTSESWAVFGELTRVFLDGQLELTAGLRYFEDKVGVREELRAVAVQPANLTRSDAKFHATTPRVVLTWHPSRRLTAYASYAEGFRSGGEQQPVVLTQDPTLPPYGPDRLKNYEVGVKGDLFDGRVSFDAAAYYIDWQNVQVPLVLVVNNFSRSLIVNGAAADGPGVDFNVTVRPTTGLQMGFNANWNDLAYTDDVITTSLTGVPQLIYSKGDRLNSSAEYTLGAWVDYAFPLGDSGWNGRFAASGNISAPTRIALLGAINTRSDQLFTSRASFAVEAPSRWVATLFVDNLANERGRANAFSFNTPATAPARTLYLRPRTFGVQLEYRY